MNSGPYRTPARAVAFRVTRDARRYVQWMRALARFGYASEPARRMARRLAARDELAEMREVHERNARDLAALQAAIARDRAAVQADLAALQAALGLSVDSDVLFGRRVK